MFGSGGGIPVPRVTVALAQPIDLSSYWAEIEQGLRPRHAMLELARESGGEVITRRMAAPNRRDRLLGRFLGDATGWWTARQTLAEAGDGWILANNENIGLAIVLLNAFRPRKIRRVSFWIMTPGGSRVRWWLLLLRLSRLRPLILAESESKAAATRKVVGRRPPIVTLHNPLDVAFFSPRTDGSGRTDRPLIASAGLERRDYQTLAEAIEGLDVDVEVCAVSPDASSSSALIPERVPDRMKFVDLSMAELRDLYLRADLVAVPTLPNDIDAGCTVAYEAMACGRPVVASDQGVLRKHAAEGVIRTAATRSPEQWRAVIAELLERPEERERLSRAGRARARSVHDHRAWIAHIIGAIQAEQSMESSKT